jgi:glycosyltransferase involved in cell wall biosynthesis
MQPPLRLALNAKSLMSPFTGIAQYTRNLSLELEATGEVEIDYFYGLGFSPELRSVPAVGHEGAKRLVRATIPKPYMAARFVQQTAFSLGAARRRFALYHDPNYLPYRFDGPTVVTAHDLSWIRYPETHPAERVAVMNDLFPAALERANHVLTDAGFVREEIIDEFGVAPERITSVPLGARSTFHPRTAAECDALLAERGLTYRGYILCVGTLEPRKNLQLAIRAYAELPRTFRERCPLVLVGMKGWLTSNLESLMQPLVAAEQIRPQGFTADEVLAVLYAGAQALVYPSLYEGFGLPPLEAMASGTPVIVSNRSTLPEVVGEAGVIIDAEDESGLREALLRFDEDAAYWQGRASASLTQASRFSWRRCAEQTLAVYRQVLAQA